MSKRRKRKTNKNKSVKSKLFTTLKVFFILILIVGVIGATVSFLLIKNALKEVREIDPSKIDTKLLESSVILDDQGNKLENLHQDGIREIVKYEDVNENLINAFVATEDKTFFSHSGFNFIRMIGAVKDSVLKGKSISGTSTITQQLARNLYLFDDRSKRTLNRKIKEAYYAIELEKYLTKEQIIEAYINKISLGAGTKGVQAASRTYFSKEASELSLVESALLAGIPKSPPKYQPLTTVSNENIDEDDIVIRKKNDYYSFIYNPNCEDRYQTVLYLMRTNNYITEKQYEEAKNINIPEILNPNVERSSEISSYFSDMVKEKVIQDLMKKYDYSKEEAENYLYTGGLEIYSTIDFDLQKTLENAYAANNFTKYYGQEMKSAIKSFQKKYDLTVDGYAGKNTQKKFVELGLIEEGAIESNVLKLGMENEEVVLLKEALHELDLFSNNDLFPRVEVYFDRNGNILRDESSSVLLYKYENLVNINDQLVIPKNDFFYDDDGNLVLKDNRRLNFYSHYKGDTLERIQVVVENSFSYDENSPKNTRNSDGSYNIVDMHTFRGYDVLIPNEFKSFDDNHNLVIDRAFINSDKNIFISEEDNLLINNENYVISSNGTIQPQSAMVITDYRTGQLKAIVGGRNLQGQKIYNRALHPRQPGSSVKPLAVYTPAINSKQYTAADVFDDIPSYLNDKKPEMRWPKNWYESYELGYKYRGISTLREGVKWSLNVVTTKLAKELGVDTGIKWLKKFGISTIVDSGTLNDHNLSAISLGGMTKGIKPIELAEAYGTFANDGIRLELITYTKVVDSDGEIILEKKPKQTKVMAENVSFILEDMMRSGVTSGGSTNAQIRPRNEGIPVAGKTGTTSSKYDAWFTGYSPYYLATTWFGNDYNLPLDEGSAVSAKFWSYVMKNIHKDLPDRDFKVSTDVIKMKVDTKSGKLPTNLSYMDPRGTVQNEYFLPGTQPTELDDIHVRVDVCKESDKIATENCPTTLIETKVLTKRLNGPYNPEEHLDEKGNPITIRDSKYTVPYEDCDVHLETIDVYEYDVKDTDKHFSFLLDNTAFVVSSFEITLNSGERLMLPIGSKILTTKDIIFPDNSVIKSNEILELPYYEEELDNFINR